MNAKAKAYWEYVDCKINEYNNNGKPTVALFCESYFPFFDGVVEVTTNYAKYLAQDYNIVMLAPRTKDHYYQPEYLTLFCRSFYLKMIHYPVAMPNWDGQFKKHLKKLRIDLVHIHGPFFMGHFGVKYARRHHLPVLGTFHTQFKRDFLLHLKWEPLTRPLVRYITRCFNKCNEVWTMNDANVAILREYGYRGATRIIPNGTELIPGPKHDALMQELNAKHQFPADVPMLMFCGRIIENKNIFLIADTLKLLHDQNFAFHMVFVGDGLDYERLQKYVKRLGIAEQVTFAGKITDRDVLGAYYQRADLLLFPSVYDTDGIVKYEAAAFQTPSLLIAGCPAAVNVTDGHNAYLADASAASLAAKVTAIFNDLTTFAHVKAQCHQDLYHHWQDIMTQVDAVYQSWLS